MQRLRAYWASGWMGKVVLSVAGILSVSCCFWSAIFALALAVGPVSRPAVQATAGAVAAAAQPTTQEAEPTATPDNIELAAATVEAQSAATPPARPTRTPAPTERPDRATVTAAEYGDKWPFMVESGIVRCVNGRNGIGEVVFSSGGKTYAVNGVAKQTDQYADITPIWKDDPQISGAKISIGPILDLGLSLC